MNHYQEWFERAPVGYFVLDQSGVIVNVNDTGMSMVGWPREQIVTKSFSEFVDQEDSGHFVLHLYEVIKTTRASVCELSLVAKGGQRYDVELHSTPSLDSKGKRVTGCFTVVSDMTERRTQENQLRERFSESERRHQREVSELERSGNMLQQEVFNHEQTEAILAQTSGLFEKIFSTSYLAIACLDRDFKFMRVNPAYAEVYGESPTFFLDKPYFDLYPNDELEAGFGQVLATGDPYVASAVPFLMMDGDAETMTWWDWNVSTLVDRGGRPEGLLLCLVDVSLRVHLERKIVSVAEHEQKRLGQELHDGMGQLLTAISIKTKILEEIIEEKTPEVVPHVREVEEMLREATVQTRDLSKLLSLRNVDTQGLGQALEVLASETQRRLGVSCDFICDAPLGWLDPVVAGHLFRIAQEAVTNALRHGQARVIRIALISEVGGRVLQIENDGKPFNPNNLEKNDGLGIRGMRCRAEMIGAVYSIMPGPIEGAVVRCILSEPEVALDVSAENY
ncbi:MAG: PAS domain-containing protein [Phycisphaeraceae bacterium]|nr:PAS domain-containing protein [Phycisphaeraceae bacterium]